MWFIEFVSKDAGSAVRDVDVLGVDADSMVKVDLSADAEFEQLIRGFDVDS